MSRCSVCNVLLKDFELKHGDACNSCYSAIQDCLEYWDQSAKESMFEDHQEGVREWVDLDYYDSMEMFDNEEIDPK